MVLKPIPEDKIDDTVAICAQEYVKFLHGHCTHVHA